MAGEPGTEQTGDFNVTFGEDNVAAPGGEDPQGNEGNPTGNVQDPHSGEYNPEDQPADKPEVSLEISNIIPEELKETFLNDPDLAALKTPQDITKALIELKTSTKGMVKIPTDESTPEEMTAFFQKLGCPETPEGYELSKELPEGLEFSEEMFSGFTQVAQATGITQKQAKAIYEFYNNKSQEVAGTLGEKIAQTYKKSKEDGVVALQKEWGTDYKDNLDQAVKMGNTFLSAETKQYLNASKLGNHPALIKDFYKLSQQVGGAQMRGGDAPKATTTYAELETEMENNLRASDYTTNVTLQARNKVIADQMANIKAKG